jgi:glycogen operon protein
VRDFWRGEPATVGELASRLTGSSDLYQNDTRRPVASINFVTAHDGFPLHDLVSYHEKHNWANGENNADGESHNRSWNCGAEGDSEDPSVLACRARQQRNALTTLFLSQGVPMLLGGDELGRTQRGNNNAYCQDNDISWVDWSSVDVGLLEFTRWLIAFRRSHPTFRRRRWFQGRAIRGTPDIGWFRPDGRAMTNKDWNVWHARTLGVFVNGRAIPHADEHGQPIVDDSFLLLFNAHHESIDWLIPRAYGQAWTLVLDTATYRPEPEPRPVTRRVTSQARSVMLFRTASP